MGERPIFNPLHIQDLMRDSNNNNAIGFNIEWCTPKLFNKLNYKSKCENNEKIMNWGVLLGLQHFMDKGLCWSSEMGLEWTISKSIAHTDLHKPNNQFISVYLEHFLCKYEPWANTNSQNSSWPGLGGNHHLPLYSISYTWSRGVHLNVILFRDSQVGSHEIP